MIVLKKSTTSLPILNLGMHEYRTGEAVTINSHTRFILLQVFHRRISVKVYGFSQEKDRGTNHRCIVFYLKKTDIHESEAGEKPHRL